MWVTTKEAAAMLGISERSVQRRAASGRMQKREVRGQGRGGVSVLVNVTEINEKSNDTQRNDTGMEKQHKKITKLNEKLNDTGVNPSQTPKRNDTQRNDTDQISQSSTFQDDSPIETTLTTGCVTTPINRQVSEMQGVTENPEMSQGGVTKGVTSGVVNLNDKEINEIGDSLEWIPIDQGVTLSLITKRTIYRKIEKRQIATVKVKDASCGMRTYLRVSDISPAVEMKWHEIQRSKMKKHLPAVLQKEKATFEVACSEDRSVAWARLGVVKAFYEVHDIAAKAGKCKGEADEMFMKKLDARDILADEMRTLGVVTLGLSTIKRWATAHKKSGNVAYPVALIPRKRGAVGRKRIKADTIRARIRFLASDDVNLPATIIYRKVLRENGFTDETCPMSPSTVYNLVNRVRKDELMMAARKGKEAYKNRVKPHLHRLNDCEPGDIWESDGHTMNNVCYNPFFYEEGYKHLLRPVMMAWLDVATGMCTGWALYSSENFHLMVTSFADGIAKWGVPRKVRLDNGSAYKNVYTAPDYFAYRKNKKQTAAQRTALALLGRGFKGFYQECGVEKVQYVIPGNAESKQIEPAWRYMLVEFEKSASLFMGETTADRPDKYSVSYKKLIKEYGDQILTWNEYVRALGRAIDEYNNRKRDVLQSPSGPLSPVEMYLQFPENIHKPSQPEIERVCRDMLPTTRTVSRGEIHVMGMYYRHPVLADYLGRKVQVYYDERHLESVQVASLDGEIWPTPAERIIPSSHMNPEQFQKAIQANNSYQKKMLQTYAAIQNAEEPLSIAAKNAIAEDVTTMLDEQSRAQKQIKDNQQSMITSKYTIGEMLKTAGELTPHLSSETEEPEARDKRPDAPSSPFLALSKKVNG